MKKNISIFFLLTFMLISSTIAFAGNDISSSRPNTPIDKEWKISFSLPVEKSTIGSNISVIDESGTIISIKEPKIDETGKIISIAPLNEYEYSTKYYLLIKDGLKSKDTQQNISPAVKMEFITVDKTEIEDTPEVDINIKEKVLGTWRTSYSGVTASVTFNSDNTCVARASIASSRGTYSISGNNMTVNLMGRQKAGVVTFNGPNEFIVLSSDGSSLLFTR